MIQIVEQTREEKIATSIMKVTKYLMVMLFIGASFVSVSQKTDTINERQAMKEKHIDLTKQLVYFVIHGLIEIDGHVFKNDTCADPVLFIADLSGIKIKRKNDPIEYKHRKCEKEGCNIIHLIIDQEDNSSIFIEPPNWRKFIYN